MLSNIDRLTEIGNDKKCWEQCELNVAYHFELKKWMIKRTLVALDLLKEETSGTRRKTKENKKT